MNIPGPGGPVSHARRGGRAEFLVYFTLIFCIGILPRTAGWAFSVIRHGRLPDQGPLARAWRDAHEITPMIFSG